MTEKKIRKRKYEMPQLPYICLYELTRLHYMLELCLMLCAISSEFLVDDTLTLHADIS